jgi:helicase
MSKMKSISTSSGTVSFPFFFPVTTFGGAFPLDELVRPYLKRFSPGVMVSYHYAKMMTERPEGILFVDSGGFAGLFDGAKYVDQGEYTTIQTKEGDQISPSEILAFQEKYADIGATVDLIIPPGLSLTEAEYRQSATIKNALWALRNRSNKSFRLFASIQAWDGPSARRITEHLLCYPFDGFALGGMVPRIRSPQLILEIITGIRSVDAERPLHVFGIGSPHFIKELFERGVDSVDSSSYVRAAAGGKRLSPPAESTEVLACYCAACRRFGSEYLELEGETNRMALALHNLAAIACATTQRKSIP